MTSSKRKAPSRLMESMREMIETSEERLVSSFSDVKHSFEVDTTRIEPDPAQARQTFSEAKIQELADSLKEHGQLQPILLRRKTGERGTWIIVAGERRWRAARLAGIPSLLAIERIEDYDVASLIENLQREDLNPVEEALGIFQLANRYGWSQRETARKIGRSASDINGMMAVARLPEASLQSVLTSEHYVSRNVLIEICRLPNEDVRDAALKDAIEGRLSIAQLRDKSKPAHSSPQINPDGGRKSPSDWKDTPKLSVRSVHRVAQGLAGRIQSDVSPTTLASLQALHEQLTRFLDK